MTNDYSLAAAIKPLALSAALATALTGCASISPSGDIGSNFQRGIYATAGLGASRLEPSVDENPELDVNDRVEPAGQVTVGADLTPTFSLEVHSADLGSAGFSPSGSADNSSSVDRVNYHMNGISALAYLGSNKHNANRKGLTGYGRLGLAAINDSLVNDNVNFEREDTAPVLVGAGLEYATSMGLGLRAEAMTNGSDASFGQVGVLYRLGLGSKKTPKLAKAAPVAPVQLPKPAVAAARVPTDSDRDGVMDDFDRCPSSARGASVDSSGCEFVSGQIDMVLFDVDSSELTGQARSILNSVASQMTSQPNATLNLEGHADSTGDAGYNQDLSKRRARTVASYLVDAGVKRSQLNDVNSYGEMSPAQNNDTVSGRAANRRVELHATGFAR